MKIFVTIQKNLVFLGINASESNRFNWKNTMGFLLLSLNLLSSIILIYTLENDDLMGYINGFVSASTMFEMFISFATIVSQQVKLFRTIKITEKIINRSNSSQIFICEERPLN